MIKKIREFYNKIIEKIGLDKIAHFSVYGMAVACAGIFGWLPALITFVIMWVLACTKEEIDETGDWRDIVAGVVGGIVPMILVIIQTFIK